MEKLFDIKLDTTSEYVCDKKKWPKACCDVMIESNALTDMMCMLIGADNTGEDGYLPGYVDIYASIDPERCLVTEFLVIFKHEDGKQEEVTVKVSSTAGSVHYYKELEKQGGEEFVDFIKESLIDVYTERSEYTGCLIDIVDDFLEEKEVRIPSSDKEMKEAGDWDEDGQNAARIYGSDYDELKNCFEATLHVSPEAVLKDRAEALLDYYYEPENELDYYTELREMGVTLAHIERWYGELEAEHTRSFWEEHGVA